MKGNANIVEALNQILTGELTREAGDNGTRELLAGMLVSEEEHIDWLETQIGLVDQLGETNYLAGQMRA